MGVAVGDYDNDGSPDLYVTNFGRNIAVPQQRRRNVHRCDRQSGRGGRRVVVQRALRGLRSRWQTGSVRGPLSGLGLLEEPAVRRTGARATAPTVIPTFSSPPRYLLYHNNGDGTFTDVSAKSGIAAAPGKGPRRAHSTITTSDGWPDILVANDAIAEQLFHNNRNGTFSEVGLPAGLAYDEDGQAFSGMGVDFEDYDNDGWPDVFIGDLANQKYALFHNVERRHVPLCVGRYGRGPHDHVALRLGYGSYRLRQRRLEGLCLLRSRTSWTTSSTSRATCAISSR